jgi:hypothetical protein
LNKFRQPLLLPLYLIFDTQLILEQFVYEIERNKNPKRKPKHGKIENVGGSI